MKTEPLYTTVKEIAQRPYSGIVRQTIPRCHLHYSSPGTLHYNSPGAYGFGVKRAGLLLPESVMLLVAPGCCGRNSTIVGNEAGYIDRMYYLHMDETDLVTGRHLAKIPEAASEICNTAKPRPKAMLICITCVDALLGTDMERVCRKAEQVCGIPVVPCYMYAITREGKKPPMVAIRQALYSCLKPTCKQNNAVNLLGNFAPLNSGCELPALLRQGGIEKVNQISACGTFSEYLEMGGARLNMVVHPDAQQAALDLKEKLGTPFHKLRRLYEIDGIKEQYQLLGKALGTVFDDRVYYEEAALALKHFCSAHSGLKFAVGQMLNGNTFELSLALIKYGFTVPVIFSHTIDGEDLPFIEALRDLSPETRVYSSVYPTMLNFDGSIEKIDVALGQDAGYYFSQVKCVAWNSERQPFGYRGLTELLRQIDFEITRPQSHREGECFVPIDIGGRP